MRDGRNLWPFIGTRIAPHGLCIWTTGSLDVAGSVLRRCIHAEKDRSPSYPSFAPTPVILNHGNHGFSHAILLGEIYECGDMLVACLGEVLVAADCDLGVTTDHATPHGFRVTNERWKRGACVSFTFVEKVAIARSWGPVFLRPPIDTDDRALTFALRGSSLPQSSPQVNALWRQRTDQWGFILQHNYSGMWKATCTCTRASWSEVANVTPPSPPPPPSPQAELVPSTNEPRAAPDPQTSDFFAAPKHVSHAAVPAATQESPFPSTTPPQRSEFPASVMLELPRVSARPGASSWDANLPLKTRTLTHTSNYWWPSCGARIGAGGGMMSTLRGQGLAWGPATCMRSSQGRQTPQHECLPAARRACCSSQFSRDTCAAGRLEL
jgi:hypothetical protein